MAPRLPGAGTGRYAASAQPKTCKPPQISFESLTTALAAAAAAAAAAAEIA